MDHREHSLYPSHSVQCRHDRMLILLLDCETDDWTEHKAQCVVCPGCQGRGQYVNPSIDSNGLSAEDFAEDPDFAEDYRSGRYDVQCRTCNGMRVILEPLSEDGKRLLNSILQYESQSRAEYEAERRMGA